MNEATALLRRYLQERDDDAFRQIVARYFNFVHGVAARRLAGNSAHASDVVQMVFIDLARNAHKLRDDCNLGGWLHRHALFVTSKFVRAEARRAVRERQAVQMQTLDSTGDDPWPTIAPIIDEALENLPGPDRFALLLRYFEGRDLRSVGEAFCISEDAAQKRVQRALERLKSLLEQKGVVVSALALGVLLAVNAAPAIASPSIDQISEGAATARPPTGIVSSLLHFKVAAPVAILLLVAVSLLKWPGMRAEMGLNGSTKSAGTPRPPAAANSRVDPPSTTATSQNVGAEPSGGRVAADDNTLVVRVVDATTKQPIRGAKVRISNGVPPQPMTEFVEGDTLIVADQQGVARVSLANTRPDRLMLQIYADDHADWVSIWDKAKGEIVPAEYTVALEPGAPLGGRILDAVGRPVERAQVRFGVMLRAGTFVRGSQQMAVRPLTNITDTAGNWLDTHIPESAIDKLSLLVVHEDFVKTNLTLKSDEIAQLRNRSFVLTLAKGFSVAGRVTTRDGAVITNALVSHGSPTYIYRVETTTDTEGRYVLKNLSPEAIAMENVFSVIAPGYAATNVVFPAKTTTNELNFALEPGGIIRGRVMNTEGAPLSNIRVIREPSSPKFDGIRWYMITGEDGRFFWNSAPQPPQTFYFGAPGYAEIRNRQLSPGEEEQVIVLQSPTLLKGIIKDAMTGNPIPLFYARLAAGTKERIARRDVTEYEFKNGAFEFPLGNSSYNFVSVRAPGYLTAAFQIPSDNRITAELQRSRTLEGVVLDAAGHPASNTEISCSDPSDNQSVRIGKGRLVGGGPSDKTLSDNEGHFSLQLSAPARFIVAVHPTAGMALTPLETFDQQGKLQLRPWARVEGTVLSNGIPLGNQEIRVISGFGLNSDDFKAGTDAAGRFAIETLPPQSMLLVCQPFRDRFAPNPPRPNLPLAQTNFTATPGAVTYIELDVTKAANLIKAPTSIKPSGEAKRTGPE